jgi:hypothetical protein
MIISFNIIAISSILIVANKSLVLRGYIRLYSFFYILICFFSFITTTTATTTTTTTTTTYLLLLPPPSLPRLCANVFVFAVLSMLLLTSMLSALLIKEAATNAFVAAFRSFLAIL